jgi:NAD(P)-dependent dehydrogenase (short-subunit alcohol dehydrogenase family)
VAKIGGNFGWSDEASDDAPAFEGLEHRGSRGAGLLEGKVVLLTGASRGIGSTAARLLASHGAKVAINFRKSEARAARVKEIIEAEGGTVELFQADVTDFDQVKKMVGDVLEKFGRIDVLVSNAAIGFKMKPFVEHEWEDFQRKVNDEVAQLFFLCKEVVPRHDGQRRRKHRLRLQHHVQIPRTGLHRAQRGQGGTGRLRAVAWPTNSDPTESA